MGFCEAVAPVPAQTGLVVENELSSVIIDDDEENMVKVSCVTRG